MKANLTEINYRAQKFYEKVEQNGVPVNLDLLRELKTRYEKDLEENLKDLEAKEGFRPSMKVADWEKIANNHGHSLPKTGKNNQPQTNELIIERYGKKIPSLLQLSECRKIRLKISKLTTIETNLQNGRVHPKFNHDPELGRVHQGGDAKCDNWEQEFKNLVQLSGYKIVVVDYERIEVKVLAFLSGDKQLIEDLKLDPYREFAKDAYKTENPTPEQRKVCKTTFLAMINGDTERGMAAKLGIKTWQAHQMTVRFERRYPKATAFRKACGEIAWITGEIESYHGRIKKVDRSQGEDYARRLGMNNPLQNTAGDLAKVGFCNLGEDPWMKESNAQILTTIHDAVILAVPVEVSDEEIYSVIQKNLVEKNDGDFGLTVSVYVGDSWGTVKEVKCP